MKNNFHSHLAMVWVFLEVNFLHIKLLKEIIKSAFIILTWIDSALCVPTSLQICVYVARPWEILSEMDHLYKL